MQRMFVSGAAVVAVSVLGILPAHAQLAGHNLKGDYGLMAGSQPDPGVYVTPLFLSYDADSLRNRDGDSVGVDPERRAALNARGYSLILSYVTDIHVLGGNLGFMVAPSWANNNLEIPILQLERTTDTGVGDLYFQPFVLGWHLDRVDFVSGVGVFAPTGRYEKNAADNVGLGMWSYEFFGGTTVYFDEQKSWHASTSAFYETHTKKQDSEAKVGDILTLEGGAGKSFLGGGLNR